MKFVGRKETDLMKTYGEMMNPAPSVKPSNKSTNTSKGSHFHSDSTYIYVDDDYMELYIPLYFFDQNRRYAVDYSSTIETLGLIHCGLFKNGKVDEIKLFKHPYFITLYNHDSDMQNIEIPYLGSTPCKVLKYTKGAILMNASIIQDAQSSLMYLQFQTEAMIPKSVPYDKLAEALQRNKAINKVSFGVRNEVEEMMIAAECKLDGDMSKKFAQVYGSDLSVSPHSYKPVTSRQVCQYSSTFAGITFEDMDSMITTSINRARNKTPEEYTPIEAVIKM